MDRLLGAQLALFRSLTIVLTALTVLFGFELGRAQSGVRVHNVGPDATYSVNVTFYAETRIGMLNDTRTRWVSRKADYPVACSVGFPTMQQEHPSYSMSVDRSRVPKDTVFLPTFNIFLGKPDYDKLLQAYYKTCTTLIPLEQTVTQLEAKLRQEYFARLEAEMSKLVQKIAESPEMVQKIEELLKPALQKELLSIEGDQ